jgi:glycine/D-amino acid oxidase-like deaminating enzyme
LYFEIVVRGGIDNVHCFVVGKPLAPAKVFAPDHGSSSWHELDCGTGSSERRRMSRITIVGGGIMGSSIAYHLGRAGIARDITVIEPDPAYELAATTRAVGGVRRLFGNRENVEMSHYSRTVYTAFDKHVTGGATTYDPGFRVEGYMFLVVGAESAAALEACAEMQNSVGARVGVPDRSARKARYPG